MMDNRQTENLTQWTQQLHRPSVTVELIKFELDETAHLYNNNNNNNRRRKNILA